MARERTVINSVVIEAPRSRSRNLSNSSHSERLVARSGRERSSILTAPYRRRLRRRYAQKKFLFGGAEPFFFLKEKWFRIPRHRNAEHFRKNRGTPCQGSPRKRRAKTSCCAKSKNFQQRKERRIAPALPRYGKSFSLTASRGRTGPRDARQCTPCSRNPRPAAQPSRKWCPSCRGWSGRLSRCPCPRSWPEP